VRTEHRSGGIL